MSEPTGETARVTYSVAKLLDRIDVKLEKIDHKLDQKADVKDVDALSLRVSEHDRSISDLRSRATEKDRAEGLNISRKTTLVLVMSMFIPSILTLVLSGAIHL